METVNVKKWFPKRDLKVILKMKSGETRIAVYNGGGCFHFLDCTHPMQNVNCPYFYCEGWQYLLETDIDHGVIENYFDRVIEGEEILKSINMVVPTTFLQKIRNIFIKWISV